MDSNLPPAIAPMRYRFAAMLYDALVMLAIWITTIVALVTVSGSAVLGAWVQSLLFVEAYAFFAFFWCRRGQTLGMLAWRLRLHGTETFTPGQALRRFVGGIASFATLGLGFFWMWLDPQRKTWPDKFSGSIVVRQPKRTAKDEPPSTEAGDAGAASVKRRRKPATRRPRRSRGA